MDRLETLLRALLRVAGYEMLARIDVPARVIIDEYVVVPRLLQRQRAITCQRSTRPCRP